MTINSIFRFTERKTAISILEKLKSIVKTYGFATVEDLYNLVHVCRNPEFGSYGWTNIDDVKVIRNHIGKTWVIDLPKPILLTFIDFTKKEKEKEMKDTKKSFNRDDLKPGYIIKLRDGTYHSIQMVGRETLIALESYDKNWIYLTSGWDTGLDCSIRVSERDGNRYSSPCRDNSRDIVAVYGYVQGTPYYSKCGEISPHNRPLLWSRQETKKMTVEEIEKALGYKVEIVSEE